MTDDTRRTRIALADGGGGQLTDELLAACVMPRLGNELLNELLDSAVLDTSAGRLALTIDAYVVQPLFFPGGDIGRLAVAGTVNDLAVTGARPLGLALSLILAEGLERTVLERVLDSVAATAREAGIRVVTGDTKVVGHHQADGMYVITAGVGVVPNGRRLHPSRVQAGDAVLINGTIADHGVAVMLAREMPEVTSVIRSDAAPLHGLVEALLAAVPETRFIRDATRGGLSGVVADLAQRTGLHVTLVEESIPVRPEVAHAADMLGLDPLDVANEGKIVAVVPGDQAARALAALRGHERGRAAAVIGQVEAIRDGVCEMLTPIGGRRVLQKAYGEMLPRIC